MSERRVNFDFNTAITGVSENDGKFVSDEHDRQVMPLRGLLMQVDGVCGCHIARYGIEVKFLTEVTDEATVVAAIQSAVAKVAAERDGLFPLRGNKTPGIIIPEPEPQAPPEVIRLTAVFAGRVVPFRAKGMAVPTFEQETAALVDAIAAHEGVLRVEMKVDGVAVALITRLTTIEAVKGHVERVLASETAKSGDRRRYFPFLATGTPEVTEWRETIER